MANVTDLEHKKFISVDQGNTRVAVDAIITNQPIQVTDSGVHGSVVNEFGEANSVGGGQTADVVSFVVPSGEVFRLKFVEFDGENISRFEVLVDGTIQTRKHSYFGGPLGGVFEFADKEFTENQVIKLRVTNIRSESADFSGRIVGVN